MFRKIRNFAAAAVLVVTPMATVLVPSVVHAAVDTCTWTGAGTDSKFSTAANWSGCDNGNVPEAGDTLTFGTIGSVSNTLVNDLGFAFGGLIDTASGSGTGTNYDIDTMTFASGAVIDDTASASGSDFTNVTVTNLTGQGALTARGDGRFSAVNYTLNGVLTLSGGAYFTADAVGSSGVVVENGSTLIFSNASGATASTPSYPITLGGGSGTDQPQLWFYANNANTATAWAFANPLTLVDDAQIYLGDPEVTVNQTGSINGAGFAIGLNQGSATGSTLVLAGSPNNSATVLGTFTGAGTGTPGAGTTTSAPTTSAAAPKTPDTGFALVSAHPVTTLAITIIAVTGILFAARFNRSAASRR